MKRTIRLLWPSWIWLGACSYLIIFKKDNGDIILIPKSKLTKDDFLLVVINILGVV